MIETEEEAKAFVAERCSDAAFAKQPQVDGAGAGQVHLAPETARLFEAAEGIEAKRSTLGDFLLAQGLSRKKRPPTPPSRSAQTSRRRAPPGATSSPG